MSHVVLDLLPSHLHWQHYVAEAIICDEIALSLLKNWLKFFVFFLRLFPILTLFVTNRFQKTKLVLNLKLYIFHEVPRILFLMFYHLLKGIKLQFQSFFIYLFVIFNNMVCIPIINIPIISNYITWV